MQIVPFWLPLWTFMNFLATGVGILPSVAVAFPSIYDDSTRTAQFLSVFYLWMMNYSLCILGGI